MLRRSHDHHRDLPARRSTALSASDANRHHQDRHLMSTIAQTRYRNAAHHCRWFSAGRGGACSKPALRLRYDCNTSVDLLRLLHARITETPRSRVSFASTVLLNPIGSLRPSHAQKPNRHRARGTALRILSRDFLLWRVSKAGPNRLE